MNAAGPLVRLSLRRLTSRPLRTALSVTAVAAGVAFVFAIQVINLSPEASFRELERAVGGEVDLYMVARTQDGVPVDVFKRIASLPEVAAAAPMSQQLVRISSSGGSSRVGLIGVDRRLRAFHPPAAGTELTGDGDESAIGVYLPPHVAKELNVGVGDRVSVRYGARVRETLVAGVVEGDAAKALRNVSVALAPLGLAQSLTGTDGRITRVLLKLRDGPAARAEAALATAGGGLMNVTRKGSDAKLFASVSMIERQLASLFAMLTLLIGALLVYNVAALNAFDHRRDVSVLRLAGASRRVILLHAAAESCVVGLAGSILGVVLGRLLLNLLAGHGPTYLAPAFLINTGVVVPIGMVLVSLAAGTLAAVVGASVPTAMQLRTRRLTATETETAAPTTTSRARMLTVRTAVPLMIVAAGATMSAATSSNSSAGTAVMMVGGGMLVPSIVRGALSLSRKIMPRPAGAMQLGISELHALPGRATALATICAMCIGAVVLIGGTTTNFTRGMATLAGQMFDVAELWISVNGNENSIGTEGFDAGELSRLRAVPGVRDLRPYRLTFVDFHEKRLLVIGYAPGVVRRLHGEEFVRGDRRAVSLGLPRYGDVAISDALARSEGLRLGQRFSMPTPTGIRQVRYAATITNYGWQPGAITMGWRTFTRAWGNDEASVLGVQVEPGARVAAVRTRLRDSLGLGSPFRVETVPEGKARGDHGVQEGMARIKQARVAILIGTVLAITSALLAAVAQRRRRLASLRAIGMSPTQTFISILAETSFVLLIGAAVGIALGFAGQVLVVMTFTSAGYPVEFAPNAGPFVQAIGAIALIAFVATAASVRIALRRPIVEDLAME